MRSSFLWLTFALLITGCNKSPSASPPVSVAKPPVKLETVNFDSIMDRVKGHAGKVVVMDTWSTSCEPCMREFPGLVALAQKYPHDKLACISVSLDYEGLGTPAEQEERVLGFLKEKDARLENFLSSTPSEDVYKALKLPSIPAVFVYDRDGKLAQRFDASFAGGKPFTYKDIEAKVVELLK